MTVQIVQMSSAVIPNGRVVPFNAGDFPAGATNFFMWPLCIEVV